MTEIKCATTKDKINWYAFYQDRFTTFKPSMMIYQLIEYTSDFNLGEKKNVNDFGLCLPMI